MIISPWVRRHMVFSSPDGADGGGAAVLDAPAKAAEAPLGSVGEAYTDALTKARGETPPDRTPAASGPTGPAATGPAATGPASTGASGPAASGATGPSAKEKPATALDALMDDQPAATGATGATGQAAPENDFLKDLPETLPREGRGLHWEKARGAIATQGKTISEQAKTVADLTRQLADAKAAPAGNPAREAELQKQLDEYKDAIVGINVEYSPEHRREFIEGRATLVTKAAEKLVAFGGDGLALEKALKMPESRARTEAIKAAMGDLDQVEAGRVMGFITEIDKLDDRRAEVQRDPQGAWAKLQEGEKARATEAATKLAEFKQKTFETVSKTLPDKFFLLRTVDDSLPDAAAHNANVEQMKAAAFELLGDKAKPEDLVEAAYAKQMVPQLQKFLVETRTELRAARAALKEYEGAEPGFRGGKAPDKTPEEAKLEKSPGQLFTESLQKARGE